ncbi:DUF6910 family protein [Nocardioides sp.]|uniref:DUF6910 family protein n=1 Tax=Nocardioides sp. TaxID=35761 RepID=UPI002ED4ADFA
MDVELLGVERLRFTDGAPVRAASAVVPFREGFLVVQDDSTHAAWFRDGPATPVRLLPPVEGHELFSQAAGTKHLKPDFEAACQVDVGAETAVLIMGSGSSEARMRWVLLQLDRGEPRAVTADMTPLYSTVADALSVMPEDLNMEGACVVGDVLRWYHRGLPSAGQPSGSVDLDLPAAVAAARRQVEPSALTVAGHRTYDLGTIAGVGLSVTDVVTLHGGGLLASAAAEDTPNPRDDGPVVASGLALLEDHSAAELVPIPLVEDRVVKIEGLLVVEAAENQTVLLAVADDDDPHAPSLAARLRVRH